MAPDGAQPEEQGFDTVHQSLGGFDSKDPQDPNGIYSLTRAACTFMEQNRDRPFFVYLPHYAVHTARQARASSLERFKAKPAGQQHSHALYGACTYELDDGVGRLLQKLAELGLEQNTLVVLTSDNGGTQQSSQEPLRGNKGCYYEGGVREPFIVRWPGVTQAGSRCDVPVINVDLFPTFLAAAGLATPDGKVLDGESRVPLLKGSGPLRRDAIFWHVPGYLDRPVIRAREREAAAGFRTCPVSVIRKGDWKLHLFHEEWSLDGGREGIPGNHAVELYNLKDDTGERHDLAAAEPARRDELPDDLLAWLNATDAKLAREPTPAYHTAPPKEPKGKARRRTERATEE